MIWTSGPDFVQRVLLTQRLLDRAAWTQNRLESGHRLGVAQHEETITESVLLDLGLGAPDLSVKTYSRWEESNVSGADWIWWWQGRDRWFGGLVQAKALHDADGSPHYDMGYRPRRTGTTQEDRSFQIDRLLEHSVDLQVPAVYALYNRVTGEPRARMCPVHRDGSDAEGITIADAHVLRQRLGLAAEAGSKYAAALPLSAVSPVARPWSCLATCELAECALRSPAAISAPDLGFDDDVRELDLAFAVAAAHYTLSAHLPVAVDDPELVAEYIRQGVRTEPPRYVTEPELLTGGRWPSSRAATGEIVQVAGRPDRVSQIDPIEALDGINRVVVVRPSVNRNG